MPRRSGSPLGLDAIRRHEKKGHGQGHGADYLPWLTVHNVPSRGLSSRSLSWKTGRVQHLVSQGEQRYQFLLDWSDSVKDVREQYPLLPVEETISLAEGLGVALPGVDGRVSALTTDFLVSTHDGKRVVEYARTFKYANELDDPRVLEKFEMERRYWESRGVDWGIVVEEDLPHVMCRNIAWLYDHRSPDALNPLPKSLLQEVTCALVREIGMRSGQVVLAQVGATVDASLAAEVGTSLGVARHLLANKVLQTDMRVPILPTAPLNIVVKDPDHFLGSR